MIECDEKRYKKEEGMDEEKSLDEMIFDNEPKPELEP